MESNKYINPRLGYVYECRIKSRNEEKDSPQTALCLFSGIFMRTSGGNHYFLYEVEILNELRKSERFDEFMASQLKKGKPKSDLFGYD